MTQPRRGRALLSCAGSQAEPEGEPRVGSLTAAAPRAGLAVYQGVTVRMDWERCFPGHLALGCPLGEVVRVLWLGPVADTAHSS